MLAPGSPAPETEPDAAALLGPAEPVPIYGVDGPG